MRIRGLGIKASLIKIVVSTIKSLVPVGIGYNAPRKVTTAHEWIAERGGSAGKIIPVFEAAKRNEPAPDIYNHTVTQRYTRYYERKIPAAYVVEVNNGVVFGVDTNFIITPERILLSDLSREFGQYGGREMQRSSVIKQRLHLPSPVFIEGRVAVISTCGSNNFHHWHYDAMPRLYLLKQAGLFDSIDYFMISHAGQPFQNESLKLLGIPEERILNPKQKAINCLKASVLIVPSLPSPLGTVSPWVVDFLRNLYNPENCKKSALPLIYLSRKNVTTRKITNQEAFNKLLSDFSIVEIFPEDYSVSQLTQLLAGAKFIISIHGSGLSNICFISEKTTIVDILAPYHQDGYYWMISNIRNAKYIGFFGDGAHPPDNLDLVKYRVDHDIYINIDKMRALLTREIVFYETN